MAKQRRARWLPPVEGAGPEPTLDERGWLELAEEGQSGDGWPVVVHSIDQARQVCTVEDGGRTKRVAFEAFLNTGTGATRLRLTRMLEAV